MGKRAEGAQTEYVIAGGAATIARVIIVQRIVLTIRSVVLRKLSVAISTTTVAATEAPTCRSRSPMYDSTVPRSVVSNWSKWTSLSSPILASLWTGRMPWAQTSQVVSWNCAKARLSVRSLLCVARAASVLAGYVGVANAHLVTRCLASPRFGRTECRVQRQHGYPDRCNGSRRWRFPWRQPAHPQCRHRASRDIMHQSRTLADMTHRVEPQRVCSLYRALATRVRNSTC